MSRSLRRICWSAGLALLASACTSTYGPGNLPQEDTAVETPVCDEMGNGPGCQMDNPDCTDPSDYCDTGGF